jgi:hypothetical protein
MKIIFMEEILDNIREHFLLVTIRNININNEWELVSWPYSRNSIEYTINNLKWLYEYIEYVG